MKLWHFLTSHSEVSFPRVIGVASIAGLSNALLLVIVNSAAHAVTGRQTDLRMFVLFVIAITTYVLAQRQVLRVAAMEVERIIERLRVNLADKIRHADLQSLEGIGRAQIFAGVNTQTQVISQSTTPLLIASQGIVLVAFSLAYIFVLSQTAFWVTAIIVVVGIYVHLGNREQLMTEMARSSEKEQEFFTLLTHLLEGFKEVRISSARGQDLHEHLRGIASEAATSKAKTAERYANYYIFTQVLFYLLIGAMVFILPTLSEVYSEQVTRLTAAVLFIIGPLSMAVAIVPTFRAADHAVENIQRLEAALDQAQQAARDSNGDVVAAPSFESIQLNGVTFSYRDERERQLFTVGPLNFSARRGEIVLVVGGNGSGKSTFLKLLTALYYPEDGSMYLDGVDVRTVGYQRYRELFSAIFSDYHLFERLYGIADAQDQRVFELLRLMQIEDKTTFLEGGFQNQELSTGQKKRLALIVAMLEDRPVYIFDEWAADQDPEFRAFFYETLLPELRDQGKTVIAATHDDRYFGVGDRVMKMESGQFVETTNIAGAADEV